MGPCYSIVYIIAKMCSFIRANLLVHLCLSDVYRETKNNQGSMSINLHEQIEGFISVSHYIENVNKLSVD